MVRRDSKISCFIHFSLLPHGAPRDRRPTFLRRNPPRASTRTGERGAPAAPIAPKKQPGGRELRPGCLFLGKPPSLWLRASCQGRLWGPPREGFQGRGVPPPGKSRKGAVYPPPYQSPGGTAGPTQARGGAGPGREKKNRAEGSSGPAVCFCITLPLEDVL